MNDSQALIHGALKWLRTHRREAGGVAISDLQPAAYPEVTGYWIPTLLAMGEENLALDLGEWLCGIQLADGAFRDCDGRANPFDTGQVVRGLFALASKDARFREPLSRACEWLIGKLDAQNLPPRPFDQSIPTWVLIYSYEPAERASRWLGQGKWADRARECVQHFSKPPHGPAAWDSISHFYGYWLEALMDAGLEQAARGPLALIAETQAKDGAVPAFPKAPWVCVPGLAQIGIAWHKAGMTEPAAKALRWLAENQAPTGGWKGSVGRGAAYFAQAEISWGVKFAVDLALCVGGKRSRSDSASRARLDAKGWAEALGTGQGDPDTAARVRAGRRQPWTDILLRWTRSGQSLLELGSGTGEMAANLAWHDRKVTLLDQSPACLASARELFEELGLKGEFVEGDLEKRLPFENGQFDVLYSSGVLEHYDDETITRLLTEFARVARVAVITLVPNASSLPYRFGKKILEQAGRWKWGHERPLATLRPHCVAAGLACVEETSVGLLHSLEFLRDAGLERLADELRPGLLEAGDWGNGYLLACRASKKPIPTS
ncbi:MAG: class I SAM-dependent methyltransferase [Verrucomicrobiae bacterium]|nr:class I SAM-dependent methyltransferase [Verrucomicrobiae bacterium]